MAEFVAVNPGMFPLLVASDSKSYPPPDVAWYLADPPAVAAPDFAGWLIKGNEETIQRLKQQQQELKTRLSQQQDTRPGEDESTRLQQKV
jgi:hypothetical protein